MPASALACDPPVVIQPAFTCTRLQGRPLLDEPLFQTAETRELVVAAFALDAALERGEKVASSSCAHDARLHLERLCSRLAPHQAPCTTLQQLGLTEQLMHLGKAYGAHASHSTDKGLQAGAAGVAYLPYVNALNQVVMMATQLYNDATHAHHHKYAAHQIALLYQALNMLQGDTKPIRRCIETRFDVIKAISESAKPLLPVEVASWLQSVSWVCREEVTVCPVYMHKRLQRVTSLAGPHPKRTR